jgi:hypothetical protein
MRKIWKRLGIAVLLVALAAAIVRALLPSFVVKYVNRTIDRSPLYEGRISGVQLHLWRGAYSIEEVRLNKVTGNVPVPLFAAKRLDLSIQWNALWHGKIVGRLVIEDPELNFVDASTEAEGQTGTGGPWLDIIQDLFPFRINSALIRNGSVHFRTYQKEKPVDVYLSKLQCSIQNLSNIRDETAPLIATVQANGLAMDHAKVEFRMTLDPFSYRPTFQMVLRLLNLDVTQLNDLARAYGQFDFEHGWFDLVIEADAKEGQLTGYAKPLFRELKVFSLKKDLRDENVLVAFWQALVGAVTTVFKNQSRDQFGTLIPFTADLSRATRTDILATIGNVLRNAFVRAYLPRLEGGAPESLGGLKFSPAELTDPISAGNTD